MGGKRRLKNIAHLARREQQQSPGKPSISDIEAASKGSSSLRSAASDFQQSPASFLIRMESGLRRLQKPLGFFVAGNVAVGAYLFYYKYREDQKLGEEASTQASAIEATSSIEAHHGQMPLRTREEEGGHEGPSGTSLISSGGATFSTPGGTPVPMPSFAASDHHPRHHHSQGEQEHAGPSNTSLVGSGGATLSTPGGTPIPLPSQSLADHHLRKGEGGQGAASVSKGQQEEAKKRLREREIELDQNGDTVTRGPSEEGDESQVMRGESRDRQAQDSGIAARPLEVPNTDLALEQYRQELLQELEKRRKVVPLNKEEKALIDQEKAMIKEHLRHLPKSP